MGNFICIMVLLSVMSGFVGSLLQQQIIQEKIIGNIQVRFYEQLNAESLLQGKYEIGYIPDDLSYACPLSIKAYKTKVLIGNKKDDLDGIVLQKVVAIR